MGEQPQRECEKKPRTGSVLFTTLTFGFNNDPEWMIHGGALFEIDYDLMVIVKDIDF